ncbi:MAG: DUF6864 domain-containing function [Verrucomicrobiia bacterium]
MKITSGTVEVFDTGTVITYDESPLVFTLDDGAGSVAVRFVFSKDEKEKPNWTSLKVVTERELEVHLINFERGVKGVSNLNPIRVGTLKGRELLLRYNIRRPDTEMAKLFFVSYTWYLGKEVANG